ncbi:hypothetical protein RMQ97_09220 [Maricaulis sp. D1M11]|uniref:hypothetical protein n=1 Tax=Maricaulis sp. D1M11 TaxID=3076117 RepID=UPI0039B54BE6
MHIRTTWPVLLLIPVLASGCKTTKTSDAVFFAEEAQIAFSLTLAPNAATSSEPAEMSLAYKRSVFASIPGNAPVSENPNPGQGPSREAQDVISMFGTTRTDNNDFTIRSAFSTGQAARALGNSASSTNAFLNLAPEDTEFTRRVAELSGCKTALANNGDPEAQQAAIDQLGISQDGRSTQQTILEIDLRDREFGFSQLESALCDES